MKIQIIVGIILIVITGLLAKYKIFDEKVELKYSLSAKIPSDFTNNNESGIQQLKLKNSGDVTISQIVLKTKAKIEDVKINKFKYTDSVSISIINNYMEIIYPELPPAGEILVLLQSSGDGLTKENIQVYHSKGIGKEAFSENNSYSSVIFYLFTLAYLLVVLYSLKNTLNDLLETKAKYGSFEVLKRNKPWYINETNWISIRKKAISSIIDRSVVITLEKSELYQILNSSRKPFLNDEEWNSLITLSEDKLKFVIVNKIYSNYYNSVIDEFINLKKPINISFEVWKQITEEISIAICTQKLKDLVRLPFEKELSAFLKEAQPEVVLDKDWKKLKDIAATTLTSLIIKNNLQFIKFGVPNVAQDLEFLDTSKKNEIESLFNNIHEGYKLKDYYNNLLMLFNDLLLWSELPEKPNNIESKDWRKVEEIYSRIVEKEKAARQNLADSIEIQNEFLPLKETVIKQLQIINNLLQDPESIDKVEIYENPFEKGNWENLKRISALSKKLQEV